MDAVSELAECERINGRVGRIQCLDCDWHRRGRRETVHGKSVKIWDDGAKIPFSFPLALRGSNVGGKGSITHYDPQEDRLATDKVEL